MAKTNIPQNHNPNIIRRILNLTYRTQLELVASFVIAFLLLIAQYGLRIIQQFDSSENADESLQQTTTDFIHSKLSSLSDIPYSNTIVLVLFWTGAAVLLYVSFLFISNVVITIKNEVVLDSQDYNRKRHYLLQRVAMKVLILIGFYILVAISLKFLFPHWLTMTGIFVNAGLALSTVHYFILAIIALGWNIYLLWVLGRLVFSYEKTL